jgi:hypothetical protein
LPRLLPSGGEDVEELKLWNDMIFVDVRTGGSSAVNAAAGTSR